MKCLRCDWQTDVADDDLPVHDRRRLEREQLVDHALTSGHPLCILCHRSLPPEDTQTCERCLTSTAEMLAGIVQMRTELRAHLAKVSSSLGRSPGAGDGRPLPGGNALVLLGPGSVGWSESADTTKDGDPTSVAFELTWWETEWRERFAEPDPTDLPLEAAVRRAHGYLERRNRKAAHEHPGYDEYRHDLEGIHTSLEFVTGRARAAARANADCFDCGGKLARRVDPKTGLEDEHVTCNRCHRRYTPGEYAMALRASSESGLQGWVPIGDAAVAAKRSVKTLESWVTRQLITTVCLITWTGDPPEPRPGRQLVWWPDVEERTHQAQRRRHSA